VINARIVTWDWKEQVDFDELRRVIAELSGGQVHMAEVDTDSDQFAWVLADGPITSEQANEIYRRRWEEYE
jgi:hypothetical protein